LSISSIAALIVIGTPAAADLPPEMPPPIEAPAPAAEPVAVQVPEQAAPDAQTENEIIVSGSTLAPPGDPLVQLNAQSYEATQKVDEAFVAPLAKGYEDIAPKPVRTGLRNFFRNLKSPIIALNYLLQLKPGKAAETIGRFAINSTIGVAGFVDVAKKKPFNLPYRPNGFADTLGYYGVGPGPYFFLPLIGPTTLRDLVGGGVDAMVLPTAIGGPFADIRFSIPALTIGALDYRVRFDDDITAQQQAADPYTASKEHYLKMRQAEIDALHGRVTVDTNAFTQPAAAPAPADASLPAQQPATEPHPQD
jgi:phospholipid-binding lipoprotein MlaA